MLHDAGFQNYPETLAIRAGEPRSQDADCLEKLVPVVQQSTVDYINDPTATNPLIVDTVRRQVNNGWVYTPGVADYAVQTMINDRLVANGTDGVLGTFDADRVNNLIDIGRPVYAALGQEPPADLTADDVVTNEFLDPSISLPDLSATVDSGTPATSDAASGRSGHSPSRYREGG